MATMNAMASSRVLLLLFAAILAVVASVQGQATAQAPAPSSGGQCTPDYISELGRCTDFWVGRVHLRGWSLADDKEACCRNVRDKPNAAECLCAAFRRSPDVQDFADFANDVNSLLFYCDQPQVTDLTCPASTSG